MATGVKLERKVHLGFNASKQSVEIMKKRMKLELQTTAPAAAAQRQWRARRAASFGMRGARCDRFARESTITSTSWVRPRPHQGRRAKAVRDQEVSRSK